MANKCQFCNRKTKTNHLILGKNQWLEFCETCGDKEILFHPSGATATIKQVFDMSKTDNTL